MASTTGGFLIGFGLCLLLVSLGASLVLARYYQQITQLRDEVEQIYYITHTPTYGAIINALDFVSLGVHAIADAISWIPWLSQYAQPLRQIGGAASTMRQVRDASETAYHAIQIMEVAPQYLEYGMIFSLFLMVVGVILLARARRAKVKT